MKLKRLAASAMVVATGVVGLSVVSAGPAAAAAGVWRAYGDTNPSTIGTSTWSCADPTTITPGVLAWACAIRSRDRVHVQVAVVVRNTQPSLYAAEATVAMAGVAGKALGEWECSNSGVGANSWSACYGETLYNESRVSVMAAHVNGRNMIVALSTV